MRLNLNLDCASVYPTNSVVKENLPKAPKFSVRDSRTDDRHREGNMETPRPRIKQILERGVLARAA